MLARLSNSLWFLESQKLRSDICGNLPTLRITTYNFDKRHFYYRPSTILSKNFATILFQYFSPPLSYPLPLIYIKKKVLRQLYANKIFNFLQYQMDLTGWITDNKIDFSAYLYYKVEWCLSVFLSVSPSED